MAVGDEVGILVSVPEVSCVDAEVRRKVECCSVGGKSCLQSIREVIIAFASTNEEGAPTAAWRDQMLVSREGAMPTAVASATHVFTCSL